VINSSFEQLEALRHLGQVKSAEPFRSISRRSILAGLPVVWQNTRPDEVIETSLTARAKAIYKIPALIRHLGNGNSKF
jgi:hypothetical protein